MTCVKTRTAGTALNGFPHQRKGTKHPVGLIVQKGALVPASEADAERLRKQNLRIGQTVFAELDTERHPADLKRIHKLGQIVVQNIDSFAHLDAHQAIKRLQSESGVGCDFTQVSLRSLIQALSLQMPSMERLGDNNVHITVNVPRSLSPGAMDATEFNIVLDGLCRYLALHYWTELDAKAAVNMADQFPLSTP